jgi:hypothetical protein
LEGVVADGLRKWLLAREAERRGEVVACAHELGLRRLGPRRGGDEANGPCADHRLGKAERPTKRRRGRKQEAARLMGQKLRMKNTFSFFLFFFQFSKAIFKWNLNSLLNLNETTQYKNPMQQHECTIMFPPLYLILS